MATNKALCKDNINVEQLKQTPEEIYKEIGNILHEIYERSDTRVKLGTGILLPLLKQKKTQSRQSTFRKSRSTTDVLWVHR